MSGHGFVVLGASHWHAPWHVRALEEAGQRVVGLSDPSPLAIDAVAGDRAVTRHRGWEDALDAHPDALPVVLTPPASTPPVLERIVAERRPFVLEKPGTVSAAALEPILDEVRRRSIPTLVALVNRYADFWGEVERLSIERNWTHAHLRILAGPPQRYLRDGVSWVLDPAISGGGALRNLGVHAADAAVQLTAAIEPKCPLAAVVGSIRILSSLTSTSLHHLDVEDFAAATLETDDGRTITIEAGYAMPAETAADKEWRIHAPRWAVAERDGEILVRGAAGVDRRPVDGSGAQYLAFGRAMAALAETGEPTPGSADLGDLWAAQALVDRIYAAASTTTSTPFNERRSRPWDGSQARRA